MIKPLILTFFCAAACATTGPSLTVGNEELASLSSDDRASIDTAKQEVTAAEGEAAKREVTKRQTARQVRIAQHLIDRAEADMGIANIRNEGAQETQSADNMIPAKDAIKAAKRELARAEAELAYAMAADAHAMALLSEARGKVNLAKAKWELQKLDAINGEDPGPEALARRADFIAQVANTETEQATLKSEVAQAHQDMEKAKADKEQLAVATPAATPAPAPDVAPEPEAAPEPEQ